MRGLTHSTFAKATAFFLIAIFTVLFLISAAGLFILSAENTFFDDGVQLRYDIYENAVYQAHDEIIYDYLQYALSGYDEAYMRDYFAEKYSDANSNIFFTVEDSDGNRIYENYSEPYARFEMSLTRSLEVRETVYNDGAYSFGSAAGKEYDGSPVLFTVDPENGFVSIPYTSQGSIGYNIVADRTDSELSEYKIADKNTDMRTVDILFTGYVRETLTAKDKLYYTLGLADFFIANRYGVVVASVLSFLSAVALFIFLMCATGHRRGIEGITLNPLDKVPLDLYTAFVITVISMIVFAVYAVADSTRFNILVLCTAGAVGAVAVELMALSLILTFATRVKYGKWWQGTLVYKVLHLIFRIFRWFFRKLQLLINNLPLFWKTAVVFSALSLFEMIVIVSAARGTVFLWWFIEKILVASLLFFLVIDLKKIRKGGEEIARGNTEYRIETKNMFGDFKRHAVYLNNISDGMQNAVNDRMKSERLKTELITNVSHDLKTPLTSIVNYVDLMKKEDIQPEKAKEYLEVLDRQSKRLQKLTVDLVEASKASTGNMPVNAEKTDISVFLSQLSGEYGDRLTSSGLELIVTAPEESVSIYADGRLLWRVFDNLMNNICKYAQPQTRVYVSAEVRGSKVVVTFKNISRYALNISTDELMERFVRGDSSRNTEGSGLGLSIARSLTELQKGKLDLVVDGDLFKAIVTFERYDGE